MMGEKSAEVPMPRELASLAKQKVVWYTKRNRERKRVWDMENTFRSAIFGGFNRQDVMEYISRMASDHKESLEKFEQAIQQGSDIEMLIHEFCDKLQIPFEKISSEDFSAFLRILSLSKLLKNPNNMRGKASPILPNRKARRKQK